MLYVHKCLCRMWLFVYYLYFLTFSKNIFKYPYFSPFPLFSQTLDDFHKNIPFLSKLQVVFHSTFLLDLEFSAAFYILPAKFSKISHIFLSLILSLSLFSVRWHPVKSILSSLKVTSPTRCDKVFLNIEPLAPGLSFPGGTILWLKSFSRMFPDHLSECGLELASAVGKADRQWQPDPCNGRTMESTAHVPSGSHGERWQF